MLQIDETTYMEQDPVADYVVSLWNRDNSDKSAWLNDVAEVRNYITANSTHDTINSTNGWKNNTTIPKITHLYTGLVSVYMAALFPNDEWFRFEASDKQSQDKAFMIESYMRTKLRMSQFTQEFKKVISDWVLYGTCFAGIEWVKEYTTSKTTGERIINYVGPKLFRISPLDATINPRLPSFDESPFIRRRFVSLGNVLNHNKKRSGITYDETKLAELATNRSSPSKDWVDYYKDRGIEVDGFNTYTTYLQSGQVEILEYWGDVLVTQKDGTTEVLENQVVIIADRMYVLNMRDNPAWDGKKPFGYCPWGIVPDNLYGQSALTNLIGMQYRCDHLENMKADVLDLVVHPIVNIFGDPMEEFEWGPGKQNFFGVESRVEIQAPPTNALLCDSQIALYHSLMEEIVGYPKEASGMRTPGEKTAFEVSMLQGNADRIFQDKLFQMEGMLERILNTMFEMLVRNMDVTDVARTFDDNKNSLILLDITKEDVVADGVFRPVGAKHYALRNRKVQELQNVLMLSQDPKLAPHISGYNLAESIMNELGYEADQIVAPNIGTREAFQTQMVMNQMTQEVQGEAGPPQAIPEE